MKRKNKRNPTSMFKISMDHFEKSIQAAREAGEEVTDESYEYQRRHAIMRVHDQAAIHGMLSRRLIRERIQAKKKGIRTHGHFWTLEALRFGDELTYRVIPGIFGEIYTGSRGESFIYLVSGENDDIQTKTIDLRDAIRDLNSPTMKNGVIISNALFSSYKRAKSAAKLAGQLHYC